MKTLKIITAVALLAGAQQALAATANMTVAATVAEECNINSADMNFGAVSALSLASADHNANGSVVVTCTSGTTYTIGLGNGANYDSTASQRRMISGTDYLVYELYTAGDYATKWDTTNMQATTAGTGATQTYTVYGKVPSGQNPPVGSYSDTVVVTVTL